MKNCISRTISDLMMKYSTGVSGVLLNISSLGLELTKNKPLLFSIILPVEPAIPFGMVGYPFG